MKIGYSGIAIPEGKVKYNDIRMDGLVDKCQPKKVTPFYVEFVPDEYVKTDMIIVTPDTVLDVLISDIEKCEARLERSEDETEKALMEKCIENMEEEKPLYDCEFSEDELEILNKLGPHSIKPVLIITGEHDINEMIRMALEKAGIMFFYTAGPKEVHAWLMEKGSDIVACAAKIHTDLARGFIKGDVAGYEDFISSHNFNDCRKRGLVQVVDRGHIVNDGDIIEIRFNV